MADVPLRAGAPAAGEHPPPPTEQDRTRGLRSIVIGAMVALLAPVFGFLGGTMVGSSGPFDDLDPLFLWLFVGMVIGGTGGVVAIMGALRWHQANHGSR